MMTMIESMEQMPVEKNKYGWGVVCRTLFVVCIVANAVWGSDANLFVLSKVAMLAFMVAVLFSILIEKKRKHNVVVALPLLLICYMFFSILWSFNSDKALQQFYTEVQLLLLCITVYEYISIYGELKEYIFSLYISGFFLALYALIVYGGPVRYVTLMSAGKRLGGLIANENVYGYVFAVAAISGLYYAIIRKKRLHFIPSVLFVFFSFSSGSKKDVFLIVAGSFFVCWFKYGLRKIYKIVFAIFILSLAGLFIIRLPQFAMIKERLDAFLSGNISSSDYARLNMIRFGWEKIMEKPIFGYGLQNFRLMFPSGQYSHNNFIEVAFSLGSIGFLIYYSMYFFPAVKMINNFRQLTDDEKMMLIILLVDVFIGIGTIQIYYKFSWILMGVLLAIPQLLKRESSISTAGEQN